jgi:transcriptional regulator with XRE-family HTH domain
MAKRRRTRVAIDAAAIAARMALEFGASLKAARARRRLTLREVGRRVGLDPSRVWQVENGRGASLGLRDWVALGIAVGRPLSARLQRDPEEEPVDAGHLLVQELVLRLGRLAGYAGRFELPTRPVDPSRSTDVGLRNDLRRILVLAECVNTFGDIGASVRSSERKRAEAEAYAISIGHGKPYSVHVVWVVRATRANRALVARYPHIFESRFPGSSATWIAALTRGTEPPADPGLVWADVRGTRLFAWRRPRRPTLPSRGG